MGGVILAHQVGYGLAVLFQGFLHHFRVLAYQVAVDKVQHGEAAFSPPAEADGIGIGKGGGNDPLAVGEIFHRPQPVPQFGGLFKAQLLRRLLHLTAQVLQQLAALALQDQGRLAHAAAIFLAAAVLQAPAQAGAHMVIETGSLLADVPGELPGAVRQQQSLADGADHILGLAPAAERAIIPGAVLGGPVGKAHAGVLLPHIQADEGIALVVL